MKKKRSWGIVDEWIKFERDANKALEERGSDYRIIHLPPKDLMPYEELTRVTKIQDVADQMVEEWRKGGSNVSPLGNLVANKDWVKTIRLALAIYKTVLLTVYGERIRKEIRETKEITRGNT